MTPIVNDLRYAARQLRRAPAFTLTAVLTLALGLGAAAAVYSVIQSVLLSPLPYPDSNRLVGVAFTFPHQPANAEQAGSSAEFVRDHVQGFSSVAVMDDSSLSVNLSVEGSRPLQISSLRVSEGYFRTLGVMPALGRAFSPAEDRPNGARVAVLSNELWQRVFNRDASIVGRAIRINQETFTVAGVMPAGFHVTAETAPGVLGEPQVWLPLQLSTSDPGYDGDNYQMIARLKPGVSLARVQLQLDGLQRPFYQQYPYLKRWLDRGNNLHEFRAYPLQDVLVGDVRHSLLTVMGAVLAVLLVACLNLAGLTLARTMRRSRELALRSALGSSRAGLLRLLSAEGLLLALGGSAAAIAVARVAIHVLLHASPLAIPVVGAEPSLRLLSAAVLGLALVSVLVFCLLPAVVLLGARGRALRLGGPSLGETASHARVSRALIVAQIALAMVLVSAASVLMGTFVKLHALPSGVQPSQLSVFQVTLQGDRYASTQHTGQFVQTVLDQLRRTPGVKRASAVNGLPLDRGLNVDGYPGDRANLSQTVEFCAVEPGYFLTMGIPVVAGRDLNDADRAGGDPVIVIGATAAKKWWPGRSPIGETIRIGREKNWRIVGVVQDVQIHSLVESQGIEIYAPLAQLSDQFTAMMNGWFPTTFAVRTAAHVNIAQAAQQAVEQADPEIPIARLTTMQSVIDSTIQAPRFYSLLAGGFSAFALVLTVIGLFGLLSYQVAQRTREIGVRMALGADRQHILRTFLGRGLTVAAAGAAIGLAATWMIRPVIAQLLSDAGVDTAGPAQSIVMNSAAAALLAVVSIFAVTLAASWLPARRAAAIEPMQALRTE